MLGAYLLVGLAVLDRIGAPTGLTMGTHVLSRGLAFLLGFSLGGMLFQSLKPTVASVFSSMLMGMLCLVPVLIGAGILVFGWQPTALLLLVLTVPLGAALGFIDWHNLYRRARPTRIPPSA